MDIPAVEQLFSTAQWQWHLKATEAEQDVLDFGRCYIFDLDGGKFLAHLGLLQRPAPQESEEGHPSRCPVEQQGTFPNVLLLLSQNKILWMNGNFF